LILIQKGRKLFAQLSDGPEKKTFDRAYGDVQYFGSLIYFEAIVMAHDKDGPFLGGYLLEGMRDSVLDLGRFRAFYGIVIMSASRKERFLNAHMIELAYGLSRLCGFSSEGVDTGIDRDLMKPGAHFCVPANFFNARYTFMNTS
jgi:hypothetical protein